MMRNFFLAFFCCVPLLIPCYLLAGTDNCVSLSDGNFNTAGNWSCGHVPDKDDNVTIAHNINLDISFTAGGAVRGTWVINAGATLSSSTSSLEFTNQGALTASGNLEVNSLSFKNGSIINIESTSSVKVYGNLTNNNNSDQITIDGVIQVDGNVSNNVNAVIVGIGEIQVSGDFTNDPTGSVFGCVGSGCNCRGCIVNASTLPVEFVEFTATLSDNKSVILKWKTATEQNNDFFSVEKSTNGFSFSEIGKIKGAGNSSSEKSYEFSDENAFKGVSYYRIKQNDFDGKFDYSEVVAVSYTVRPDGSCILKVFPNPCPGKCNVTLTDCKEGENSEIMVEVVDALGNKVQQHLPYRNSDGSFNFYMDAANVLVPGIYIIRAVSPKEFYNDKVLVK